MRVLSSPASSIKNIDPKIITALFFIFFASSVQAARPLDVVINEIAWMGSTVSYNDEWIELYNNTETEINLSGWKLAKINLSGIIPLKGFYLLERTDDNTLPNIPANQIYTGALGNKGEILTLYDDLGNLIDQTDCSGGWFGGDNSTKQTMERKNSQLPSNDSIDWGTSQSPGGTPKAENSPTISLPFPIETPTQETSPVSLPKMQVNPTPLVYPTGIVINEILPSPEGPDTEEEWIELFNQNTSEIDLSGWQLSDTVGVTKNYTFPENTIISANGFLIFSRPITKITLNNSDDGLKLIQPDGKIGEEINYESAPRGQSYNLTNSGWVWSSFLTPGDFNKTTAIVSEVKEETDPLESLKAEMIRLQPEQGLAAIGEQKISKNLSNSLSAPLVALFVATLSGLTILILKTRLQEKKNLLR